MTKVSEFLGAAIAYRAVAGAVERRGCSISVTWPEGAAWVIEAPGEFAFREPGHAPLRLRIANAVAL